MMKVGYKLSSEEFPASDLVRYARRAEEAGFEFALVSDHFHPWCDRQGESPFVWSVLGGIAGATERLRVGTAVTCPTIRIHPAIVAQAAATVASMMPGRFFLGVGTGENLNEHVVARGWPSADVRVEMLEEAIEVMRLLWKGGLASHRGRHFTVEDARLYSLPETPPELMIAANRPRAIDLAGRAGDALITTEASAKVVRAFRSAGGAGKPCYTELSVCWAASEREAIETAHEVWSLAALEGTLFTELALPSHFEAAFEMVTPERVAESVVCGPDPKKHLAALEKAARAGFTHVCVHQIGQDQEGFFEVYEREILPRFQRGGRAQPTREPGERKPAAARKAAERKRPAARARGERARDGRAGRAKSARVR